MSHTIDTLARRQVACLRDEAATAGDGATHDACERVLTAYDAQAFGWPSFLEFNPAHAGDIASILAALNGGES